MHTQDALLDETEMFPYCDIKDMSFKCPPAGSYEKIQEHINLAPQDNPIAFGLHPNAEIDYRTQQCVDIFKTLLHLQPVREGDTGGTGGSTAQQKIEQVRQ